MRKALESGLIRAPPTRGSGHAASPSQRRCPSRLPHTAAAPATHNYQPRPYLFAKCDYLRCRLSHTQVCLCDLPSSRLYLPDFLVEQLSFCPLDIRQEVSIFPRNPSRFQRREFDEGRFIEAFPADVDNVQL